MLNISVLMNRGTPQYRCIYLWLIEWMGLNIVVGIVGITMKGFAPTLGLSVICYITAPLRAREAGDEARIRATRLIPWGHGRVEP